MCEVLNATAIANEIIRQCHANDYVVSNLKLQKLLYFVQAHSLSVFEVPAFQDSIEAWEYGPVVPNVYQYFKIYGSNSIPENHYFTHLGQSDDLSNNVKTSVSEILDQLGSASAFQLVNLSHEEGSPWHQVYDEQVLRTTIPTELIKQYYSQ